MKALHANVQFIQEPQAKGQAFKEIALHYFDLGVVAIRRRNYKESLQNLHNAMAPLREAASLGVEDALALEKDVQVQIWEAESLQARATGDKLLAEVNQNKKIRNINKVWKIIDWYKQAILLTRKRDIEMEAVACSRLGSLYDRVPKQKAKAKFYLSRCLELANTLVHRNITGEDWYITATTILTRHLKETVRGEEEKKQKEVQEVLEKIKHLLDPIDKMYQVCKANSHEATKLQRIALLNYVYEKHPPQNPAYILEMAEANEVSYQDLKKIFQKAVIHYHPDKVKEEEHGKEWKVLSEEICKRLTAIYETYKGA